MRAQGTWEDICRNAIGTSGMIASGVVSAFGGGVFAANNSEEGIRNNVALMALLFGAVGFTWASVADQALGAVGRCLDNREAQGGFAAYVTVRAELARLENEYDLELGLGAAGRVPGR